MNPLGLILLIVVVVIVCGGGFYSYRGNFPTIGGGYTLYGSGLLVTILVIALILWLLGVL